MLSRLLKVNTNLLYQVVKCIIISIVAMLHCLGIRENSRLEKEIIWENNDTDIIIQIKWYRNGDYAYEI